MFQTMDFKGGKRGGQRRQAILVRLSKNEAADIEWLMNHTKSTASDVVRSAIAYFRKELERDTWLKRQPTCPESSQERPDNVQR